LLKDKLEDAQYKIISNKILLEHLTNEVEMEKGVKQSMLQQITLL
jgi:hypothetical protein